jgi:hypothetical protein
LPNATKEVIAELSAKDRAPNVEPDRPITKAVKRAVRPLRTGDAYPGAVKAIDGIFRDYDSFAPPTSVFGPVEAARLLLEIDVSKPPAVVIARS